MKRFLIHLIFIGYGSLVFGQSFSNGIVVNKVNTDNTIGAQHRSLLRSNLQTQLGGGENSSLGSLFCNAFMSQLSSQEISGMAKKKVYEYALDLTFYDAVLNQEYRVSTLQLTGSGATPNAAVKSAIQGLRSKRKELSLLKQKVVDEQQAAFKDCTTVQARIVDFKSQKKYASILALTNNIGAAHPCYATFVTARKAAYEAQQAMGCQNAISKAKASIAIGNFEDASRFLGQVDPRMDCTGEIDQVITEMGAKFSAEQMKTLEWYIKYKSDEIDIQKAQMNIISNLVLKELLHAH